MIMQFKIFKVECTSTCVQRGLVLVVAVVVVGLLY
jgi:hypothetical protein